jgi:hypothetical protein
MERNKYGKEVPNQYRICQYSCRMDLEDMKPLEMNNYVEEKHVDFLSFKRCRIEYATQLELDKHQGYCPMRKIT